MEEEFSTVKFVYLINFLHFHIKPSVWLYFCYVSERKKNKRKRKQTDLFFFIFGITLLDDELVLELWIVLACGWLREAS